MKETVQDKRREENKVIRLHAKRKKMTYIYAVLAVLVIAVGVYQIVKINYSPVKTEVTLERTISNTVTTQAFIVRDETYVKAEAVGTLVPLVTDGKRVADGDDVAVVFNSEASARNYAKIRALESDIAYFESLKNKIGMQTSDIDSMDSRVYDACEQYILGISTGNVENYEAYESAVCEAITSRQLSTGTVIDPTEKLNALKAELAALQGQSGGFVTVKADNPGYYIGHVDGYENAFDYDKAKTATGEEITALLSAAPAPTESLQNCMGKLVDSFNWYILCVIDSQSAAFLSSGSRITVEFPLSSAEAVSAEVVSVQNAGTDSAAVVLRSNLMNQQYAGLRKEQIRLVLQNFTGYRVNNKAIREQDGQKGVYILSGNIVKFKKVEIAYSDETYSVCVTPKDDNGNLLSGYVALYDEIIIEGTDLDDGKILG